MKDYLFRGTLKDLDADVFNLSQIETERQSRKIILIPSESQAPLAVREALASPFQNIYAEGYPDEELRDMSEAQILDFDIRLAHYRRYSDPRYYKGVEYADLLESLARRRVAELFADNSVTEDEIYVNVQALSGAPANNAVYHALINPGETILGMSLAHGGHLSHGSPVNRSGKLYRAVHYSVEPVSEKIDYDKVAEIAFEYRPKIIVAGYSSYPWSVDWARFRKIAKDVGAYLLADISHVAGLVAAKIYPSPVGYADVVTFTTHKTLCGPRGACILTFEPTIAKKIDRAVFPGEQGGPHLNSIAGIAVAMKLAKTEQFIRLQTQIVKNCIRFTDQLRSKGFRIPFGGTNTHLMNLDCSSIIGGDGTTLSGDQAARILDLAGIVVNRNTIPGDLSAVDPSGIRMGTTWITQRGFLEPEIDELSEIIYKILNSCQPFSLEGKKGGIRRAKIPFNVLENAKIGIRELSRKRPDNDLPERSYTFNHFNYIDDVSAGERGLITLEGEKVRRFLDFIIPENIEQITSGDSILTTIHTPDRAVEVILKCSTENSYDLSVRSEEYGCLKAWLNDLSDGYVEFGDDQKMKLPGPIRIRHTISSDEIGIIKEIAITNDKPFVVGINQESTENFKQFSYSASSASLKRTPLFDTHKRIGAKIIDFAGWEMPVWYSSIVDEHTAVRQACGLFDVSHMGIFQIEGVDASGFLDSIVGNDIGALNVGQSCYTHLLDPDANVIDDLLVYRRGVERYLLVVNASNDEKDWAWINSIREGNISVSHQRPGSRVYGRNIRLRNLRDPKEDREMRIDIALQGPKSRDILLSLEVNNETKQKILHLRRTELCEATVGKFQMIVSRTGYTGEKIAFELFVHPEFAVDLFNTLLDAGESFGIKPIGLGARDSLRTEAGLPLYGHEMGEGSGKRGFPDLGVSDAGFGSYVKTYKPWFVGREAYINKDKLQRGEVIRFKFEEKGMRMAHNGDPVLDKKGKVIGFVTSCAVNREGMLTGQAYLELKYKEEGTPILIYQSAPEKTPKSPSELQINDKYSLPSPAVVISRFPK